jgi:hypothetical protein
VLVHVDDGVENHARTVGRSDQVASTARSAGVMFPTAAIM